MEKKSFLLYFDMYPQIADLPPEQKGILLDALFRFALEEAKQPGGGEGLTYPGMSPQTEMACRFMTEAIRRDTDKWREKQSRYRQAARRRQAAAGGADPETAEYARALQERRGGGTGGQGGGEHPRETIRQSAASECPGVKTPTRNGGTYPAPDPETAEYARALRERRSP